MGRLILLSLLSLSLMFADKRGTYVQPVRDVLAMVVLPVQYAVSGPVSLFNWVHHGIVTRHELIHDNDQLRMQVFHLKTQVQKLVALEQENTELRALLSSSSHVNGKVLVAELLAVDANPFVHQVVLNKGEHQGVYVGQPVLDANGVMGQVIAITPFTSRVLLIADPRNAVPVTNSRNGLRAIAVGNGTNTAMHLIHVAKTQDFKVGDLLFTSGLGQLYPSGYPLGRISSINKIAGKRFASIEVQPSAQLDRSRQVLLVWPKKTGETT